MLPKKVTSATQVNLVHTSSPVGRGDLQTFESAVRRLSKLFPKTKVYEVERHVLDPRYLAASERERLKKFRLAIRSADWLAPIYGGTGCADIIRHLTEEDLKAIRERAPVVNGFSDTTFLLNYLFFKLGLRTFHYTNACGLFQNKNSQLFLDLVQGAVPSFVSPGGRHHWLSEDVRDKRIEGLAIGGNISTFRDLLDIGDIKPESWRPFILFAEDIDVDAEDLHRIVIALDGRKIFRSIRALVVGKMDEKDYAAAGRRFNFIFGRQPKKEPSDRHFIEYLISETIEYRKKIGDPLHVIKVDNLGHNVADWPMILPIGAKTVIHPDGRIEFLGPFVEGGAEPPRPPKPLVTMLDLKPAKPAAEPEPKTARPAETAAPKPAPAKVEMPAAKPEAKPGPETKPPAPQKLLKAGPTPADAPNKTK